MQTGNSADFVVAANEGRALDCLFRTAGGGSGHSARCAAFLLAWSFPADFGGLDLSLAGWGLPQTVAASMVVAFGLAVRLQRHRLPVSVLGRDTEFAGIARQWMPEAFGLSPPIPTPADIQALRQRHDLTVARAADMLYVERGEFQAWEQGQAPMPLALWQALRMLIGEVKAAARH